VALLAALQAPPEEPPAEPAEKPPGRQTLEERVKALESEIQRLKLQAPEPEPSPETEAEAPVEAPQPAAVQPNIFNPTLTVSGNGLYRYDDRPVGEAPGERVDRRFNVREVELDLRAAVDPYADGVVILAVESEFPNAFQISAEEAYVQIKRLPLPVLEDPPLGLKLKVGRFRTEVGRVNRLHLHDLPQATRPLVTEEIYGEEGFVGLGASGQIFLPTPFDEDSAVELTAQVLTGGGSALTAEAPGHKPQVVANLRWFRTFAETHNVDVSAIFQWARTGADPTTKPDAFVYSADVLYKWKPLRQGEYRSFVLGGQVFLVDRDVVDPETMLADHVTPVGWFAFAQPQLTRNLYLGVRYDDAQSIVDDTLERRAISGWLSWYTSEFLRFRLGYEHRLSDLAEEDGRDSFFAEMTFVLGAHPTEPFWVNR